LYASFVYLNDIQIFFKDDESHQQYVLQFLWENKLFVKVEKCEFHASCVFPGLYYCTGTVATLPKSWQSEWPALSNLKQLQHFQGFANIYRRFIRNYSRLATPLTSTPFHWAPEAEVVFLELPLLTQPDPKLQFIVEVDTSDTRVGAVLSQHSPSDQKLHPCAFFSRKLSPAEKNVDMAFPLT
jgi:hypothetical protein